MTYTDPRRDGTAPTIVEVANLSAARSVNIDNILTCTHDRTRVRVDAAPSLLCTLIGSRRTATISLTTTCFPSLVPGKHAMGLPLCPRAKSIATVMRTSSDNRRWQMGGCVSLVDKPARLPTIASRSYMSYDM